MSATSALERTYAVNVDAFTCAICTEVFTEAMLLECGHEFCRPCLATLRRASSDGPMCPQCRQPIRTTVISYKTRLLVQALPVHCGHAGKGCAFTDANHRIAQHEATCSFGAEKCELCHQSIRTTAMASHQQNDCPHRWVRCGDCQLVVRLPSYAQHQLDCPKVKVACPNKCNASTVVREALSNHLLNDCPLTTYPCPYAALGCKVTVERRDLQSHALLPSHISLLVRQLVDSEDQVEALVEALEEQKCEVKALSEVVEEQKGRLEELLTEQQRKSEQIEVLWDTALVEADLTKLSCARCGDLDVRLRHCEYTAKWRFGRVQVGDWVEWMGWKKGWTWARVTNKVEDSVEGEVKTALDVEWLTQTVDPSNSTRPVQVRTERVLKGARRISWLGDHLRRPSDEELEKRGKRMTALNAMDKVETSPDTPHKPSSAGDVACEE